MSVREKIWGHGNPYGRCQAADCDRPAQHADGFCNAHQHVRHYNVEEHLLLQTSVGLAKTRGAINMLAWPWPSLCDLTGPLIEGNVTYVAATSGGGKTTFALDLVRRWIDADIGVSVMPTEITADEWRQALATVMAGYPAGEVFELVQRQAMGDAEAVQRLKPIDSAMQLLVAKYGRLLALHDGDVTLTGVDRVCGVAKALGHRVVVIDHVDHVESERDAVTGRMPSLIEAGQEVNNGLLLLAKMHKLHIIAFTQTKAGIENATNRLMKFRMLGRDDIAGSSKKIQNAAVILGLFRPIRRGVDKATLALAREGAISVQEALAPDRMGVNAIKLRHRGRNEGEHIELLYGNGRLTDRPDHLIQLEKHAPMVTP